MMTTRKKPIDLYIAWGDDPSITDVTELFEFATQGEVNAFFEGVDRGGEGCCIYEVFDEPHIYIETSDESTEWVPAGRQ